MEIMMNLNMDKNELQRFLSDTEQLINQYQLLKEHAFHLHKLNEDLMQENRALKAKHMEAKSAINNIIDKLKVEPS